ncbi:MAG: DUF3459 domain-containing protein [Spirochaetes bacterium]|nr:DUF3459 domain-containing protein [Spirochaetota bacterium]
MDKNYLWWRDGVIYQIYPRSFADSNNDGLGDLNGICAKLDYLAELGADAIWLSPFYPSPDADFGYDISDHCAVDPRFGSMADFNQLVAEAHRRGIHVVLDLVLNHSSDQHPWFTESRSSRDNPKHDWYLWQSQVPNNWQCLFGGGGWHYDPKCREYYFHMFAKEQPDLNWRNPQVRQAQLDVVRFWLARGVDGFRLDVFNAFFKDSALRSNPTKPGLRAFDRQQHIHDIDQPEMLPLLRELRALLETYPERYAVGETFLATPERAASYSKPGLLHAAFNFNFTRQPFRAKAFRKAIDTWDSAAGAEVWPNYVLSNHDLPRSASRYCRGNDDTAAAISLALLLTLRGTAFLYYGEEIGQRDIQLKRKEIMDPPGRYYWPLYKGRDGCRAPMQWDASTHAGFSSAKPWLPPHPDYRQRNVAAQQADPESLLSLTKELIRLRRKHPALHRGTLEFLPAPAGCLAYRRTDGSEVLDVCLKFSKKGNVFSCGGTTIYSSRQDRIRISKP